jgi:hypothetical protein
MNDIITTKHHQQNINQQKNFTAEKNIRGMKDP